MNDSPDADGKKQQDVDGEESPGERATPVTSHSVRTNISDAITE